MIEHMTRILLALALLFFAAIWLVTPAYAQDSDGRWVRQAARSSCEWWETCPRHRHVWRYSRARHYEIRNVYRGERYDQQQCKEFVTAVGEERYGRERAKEAAEQTWMELVRSRHGVKWIDTRNARQGTWECGRSSTGNRASEKAQEFAGKFLEQCELKARPCRAELERLSKD